MGPGSASASECNLLEASGVPDAAAEAAIMRSISLPTSRWQQQVQQKHQGQHQLLQEHQGPADQSQHALPKLQSELSLRQWQAQQAQQQVPQLLLDLRSGPASSLQLLPAPGLAAGGRPGISTQLLGLQQQQQQQQQLFALQQAQVEPLAPELILDMTLSGLAAAGSSGQLGPSLSSLFSLPSLTEQRSIQAAGAAAGVGGPAFEAAQQQQEGSGQVYSGVPLSSDAQQVGLWQLQQQHSWQQQQQQQQQQSTPQPWLRQYQQLQRDAMHPQLPLQPHQLPALHGNGLAGMPSHLLGPSFPLLPQLSFGSSAGPGSRSRPPVASRPVTTSLQPEPSTSLQQPCWVVQTGGLM
jgi:hypothetical protein